MTYKRDTEYRGFNSPLWEVFTIRKWWWFRERYALRREINGYPYGHCQYHNDSDGFKIVSGMRGIILFDTKEEAEAKMARMNRTWPETFEYEVNVPLNVCGNVHTAHDGIRHFYLLPPYRYWCAENLSDHHGFYRYPREGGTNYIAVTNIVDAIKLKTAISYWEDGLEAP